MSVNPIMCMWLSSFKTPHKRIVSLKRDSEISKNSRSNSFRQCYSNRREKKWICWGLFSALDQCTLGALLSICSSKMVYVGLSQNKVQCVFMQMKKHVSWCNAVIHWCVFNSLFETMELCDRGIWFINLLIHIILVNRMYWFELFPWSF